MPNLFPDSDYNDTNTDTSSTEESLISKGSYLFDFDKGDFVKNPDGTIKKCNALEAYKQWCIKVMTTPIGLIAYSNLYGQELNTLSGTEYSQEAIELEVKRMTIDALMVHPRTQDVTGFSFTWQNSGELYYEYTVIPTDGSSFTLNKSTKVG